MQQIEEEIQKLRVIMYSDEEVKTILAALSRTLLTGVEPRIIIEHLQRLGHEKMGTDKYF